MDSSITPFAQLLRINTHLFARALDGLNDDEVWMRPGDVSNPMIWVAGHLVYSRSGLARLLGGERVEPWNERFARGVAMGDRAEYPGLAEVVRAWDAITGVLFEHLAQAGDRQLSAPSPMDFPVADKSVRGAVGFLTYHEAYHVGQMGYLRKWLGYAALVD
jgi:hypothetical protein